MRRLLNSSGFLDTFSGPHAVSGIRKFKVRKTGWVGAGGPRAEQGRALRVEGYCSERSLWELEVRSGWSDSARDSPVQEVVGGQGRPCEAAFGGPWKAVAAHRDREAAGAGLPTE